MGQLRLQSSDMDMVTSATLVTQKQSFKVEQARLKMNSRGAMNPKSVGLPEPVGLWRQMGDKSRLVTKCRLFENGGNSKNIREHQER